jgi:L-methionine (R)-S-oxide reductase
MGPVGFACRLVPRGGFWRHEVFRGSAPLEGTMSLASLTPAATQNRRDELAALLPGLNSLIEEETNEIALMASIACELFHGVDSYHWVGFYRVVSPGLLKVGPYQGGHGCLTIPFEQGICGRCAAKGEVQNIPDVSQDPRHIACSSTTRSELVLPVWDGADKLIGVLDIDSDFPANFSEIDQQVLSELLGCFRRVGQ